MHKSPIGINFITTSKKRVIKPAVKTSQQHLTCYVNPWKHKIIKAGFTS